MIRTMFECPETGMPLISTITSGLWQHADGELMSRHCPKCGKLHRFGPEHAIVLIDTGARAPRTVDVAAG